jgi:putative ABC transport system permease protein
MLFYQFTHENIRYFGALKAMGAPNRMLLRMILLQASVVGTIGYGLGVGLASLFGVLSAGSELAFRMPWQLLCISAGAVVVICLMSALLGIVKVMRLEPAIVFKS